MSQDWTLPRRHYGSAEIQEIIDLMPDTETSKTVAEAMKQLGDPTRLRIFWLLCHTEECVTGIASLTDMTSPAVSHHLRLLKAAGLLETKREGKEMYYKAADTPLVRQLHHTIEIIAQITCPT